MALSLFPPCQSSDRKFKTLKQILDVMYFTKFYFVFFVFRWIEAFQEAMILEQ